MGARCNKHGERQRAGTKGASRARIPFNNLVDKNHVQLLRIRRIYVDIRMYILDPTISDRGRFLLGDVAGLLGDQRAAAKERVDAGVDGRGVERFHRKSAACALS